MVTLFIEEATFHRMASKIRSICPDLEVVVMDGSGKLFFKEKNVAIEDVKPDIAWLSFELFALKRMETFADFILQAPSVKWMQTFNAGLERPFYRDILKQGIRITKSNAQAIAIAEYVIANVMVSLQKTFERKRYQDARRWEKTSFREVWRTHWLIVGFGHIGRQIATRVKAFGCTVTGVRRSLENHPAADDMITLLQLPAHLPEADVVVLACSLNEDTRGLADEDFFRKMKKGSVFVNIARGALIDPNALIAAIRRCAPQFAVLDVFDPEPLPQDSPLWTLDNTIVTPHSSYAGNNTGQRGDDIFLENLKRYLAGEPLLYEICDEKDL